MTPEERAALERQLCALLADPAAPYAHNVDAVPGDAYATPGPPWPPLRVLTSTVTPVEQVLYQHQVLAADVRPGEDPVEISVHRMVGRLADGSIAPLGDVWAVPAGIVRAAAADDGRCPACGLPIRETPVLADDGRAYHRGCVEP